MLGLAKLRFQYLRKKHKHLDSYKTWNNLSLVFSTSFNPYSVVREKKDDLPPDLIEHFYLENKIALKFQDGSSPTLDTVSAKDHGAENHVVDRIIGEILKKFNRGTFEEKQKLIDAYIILNNIFLEERDHYSALRSTLNLIRLNHRGLEIQTILANCLAEIGEFYRAAEIFMEMGKNFVKADSNYIDPTVGKLHAAKCYEQAGLLLEFPLHGNERPIIESKNIKWDSTSCFREAKVLYNSIGDYDAASRSFVLERDSHMKWTYSFSRRFVIKIMRFVWLYGESPLHAFRSIVLVWVLFAFLFLFSGIRTHGEIIEYSLSSNFNMLFFKDFGTCLYFSIVTMSTLGYGDYSPLSVSSRILAGFEAFIGMVLIAMLLVSIQRRYVGR